METLLGVLEVLVDSGPDPNFEVEYSVSLTQWNESALALIGSTMVEWRSNAEPWRARNLRD